MMRPTYSDSTTIIIRFLVTTFKVVNMDSYVYVIQVDMQSSNMRFHAAVTSPSMCNMHAVGLCQNFQNQSNHRCLIECFGAHSMM